MSDETVDFIHPPSGELQTVTDALALMPRNVIAANLVDQLLGEASEGKQARAGQAVQETASVQGSHVGRHAGV